LGQPSITADTDLRLARYFGVSEGFSCRCRRNMT
jgi:plasmid maintenance system antidote protein VapI